MNVQKFFKHIYIKSVTEIQKSKLFSDNSWSDKSMRVLTQMGDILNICYNKQIENK